MNRCGDRVWPRACTSPAHTGIYADAVLRSLALVMTSLLVLPACSVAEDEDADVAALVADLNGYWEAAGPDIGLDYEPVPLSRIGDGTDGLTCDGEPVAGEDIEDNAFVDPGCAEGLTVGYDPAYADPGRELELELTLAHEWGHVIQAQAPQIDLMEVDGLAIDSELQADCFAGGWASTAYGDADVAALRESVAEIGDELHVPLDDPDAHGTAEERVAAFSVGYDSGVEACVTDELIDVLPG